MKYSFLSLLVLFAFACKTELPQKDYASLQILFKDWRAFEVPPLRDDAPDYTKATFRKRMKDFEILKKIDRFILPILHFFVIKFKPFIF